MLEVLNGNILRNLRKNAGKYLVLVWFGSKLVYLGRVNEVSIHDLDPPPRSWNHIAKYGSGGLCHGMNNNKGK